ncbi:MAG: GAF domain-containing protein [Anaerolineae bacterium]|nr:GAF domain-containing protein [Anaerolineae bacterium]
MNKGSWAFLNPVNWPIWVKIVVLVGAGVLTLALPMFMVVRTATVDNGIDSAESYIQLNGTQHLVAVNSLFDDAKIAFDTFLGDQSVQSRHIAFLTDATETARGQLETLYDTRLLNPASTIFDEIRLLDPDGVVVAAQATDAAADTTTLGLNQSRTNTFRAATAAVAEGRAHTLTAASTGNQPALEVIHVITRRTGEPAGYLIGRIDNSRIQSLLAETSADYPVTTFLISQDDVMFAPQLADDALMPSRSLGAVRALNGQSGVQRYQQESGAEVIGYFAPLTGTPLGLVSEVRVTDAAARAFDFYNARSFVLVAGFAALASVLVAALLLLNHTLTPPLHRLRQASQALAQGDFDFAVPDSRRGDEIGALASSFVQMRDQVQTMVQMLEARLEARARDISATQLISQFAATQRDLQSLMDNVVSLLIERFPNLYHAQIFLIDIEGKNAILQASTGEAGKQLLARGHRLAVGSISIVGQAAAQKRPTIARDVEASRLHHKQQFLPETRAEMAIPLIFGEQVIGVLDVQSKQKEAFAPEEADVLQIVANQIAVAIQTARLYEESVRRLVQIEQANRQATVRAWEEYMREQQQDALSSRAGHPSDEDLSALRKAALATRQAVVGQLTERDTLPIAVPIQIGGAVLGAVEWEIPAADFNEGKLELAKELSNRLALGLENARLFQESRRAAERERMVNNIAARLAAQTNISEILQTAVREVGQALKTPQVSIRLHGADGIGTNGKSNGNGNGNGNGSHPTPGEKN